MATTASTFRRPKNKGGTRTTIGMEEGRGIRKYHSMGDSRSEYRKGRPHKGSVEVSHKLDLKERCEQYSFKIVKMSKRMIYRILFT